MWTIIGLAAAFYTIIAMIFLVSVAVLRTVQERIVCATFRLTPTDFSIIQGRTVILSSAFDENTLKELCTSYSGVRSYHIINKESASQEITQCFDFKEFVRWVKDHYKPFEYGKTQF